MKKAKFREEKSWPIIPKNNTIHIFTYFKNAVQETEVILCLKENKYMTYNVYLVKDSVT